MEVELLDGNFGLPERTEVLVFHRGYNQSCFRLCGVAGSYERLLRGKPSARYSLSAAQFYWEKQPDLAVRRKARRKSLGEVAVERWSKR